MNKNSNNISNTDKAFVDSIASFISILDSLKKETDSILNEYVTTIRSEKLFRRFHCPNFGIMLHFKKIFDNLKPTLGKTGAVFQNIVEDFINAHDKREDLSIDQRKFLEYCREIRFDNTNFKTILSTKFPTYFFPDEEREEDLMRRICVELKFLSGFFKKRKGQLERFSYKLQGKNHFVELLKSYFKL